MPTISPKASNTADNSFDFEDLGPKVDTAEKQHHLKKVIEIIRDRAFTADHWKKFFGIDTPPSKIPQSVIDFLLAKDDTNPKVTNYNYQTHGAPILMPQFIFKKCPYEKKYSEFSSEDNSSSSRAVLYTLNELRNITSVQQHELRNRSSPVTKQNELPGWLVPRNNLLFGSMTNNEKIQSMKTLNQTTSAGYETLPSALQVATILLVNHVANKKCFFLTSKDHARGQTLCKDKSIQHSGTHSYVNLSCACPTNASNWNGVGFDAFDLKFPYRGVLAVRKFIAEDLLTLDQKDQIEWIDVGSKSDSDKE